MPSLMPIRVNAMHIMHIWAGTELKVYERKPATIYRKVMNINMSCFEVSSRFSRPLLKGKFDVYLL